MTQLIPRKFDRRRFLVDVNVRRLSGGNAYGAHAIDIGESGISIFSMRFIPPGESVELEVRAGRQHNGASMKFFGSIAHARVESDGNILGIEFSRPLSGEQMQALGLPAVKN